MDLRLSTDDLELQARARAFTNEYLIPAELETEESGGHLSDETRSRIRTGVTEARLNAINHSVEDGGQGLSTFQQVLVEEQIGRATNCLWALVWHPSNVWSFATEEQKETYLRPACRGEREDCYAITEEGAGSDPSMVQTTAVRDEETGEWVISGTKWHVTAGDSSDIILTHAHVDGDADRATVFIVEKDTPGVELVRSPKYTHTSYFEHPIYAFNDVRIPGDQVLGEVGQGYDLTKDWFVEERLMIGARTVGASQRALEASLEFAKGREQFGQPIVQFQSIEFMLAEMAAEIMAAKALLYRVAWQASQPETERKQVHAMASAVKLICSKTAGRVVDKAVQIFGGRGYMREQPVERLWRELRVDRIWEGTSEIQKVVIGNELRKRGPAVYADWP